jgi:hypothetical protein
MKWGDGWIMGYRSQGRDEGRLHGRDGGWTHEREGDYCIMGRVWREES